MQYSTISTVAVQGAKVQTTNYSCGYYSVVQAVIWLVAAKSQTGVELFGHSMASSSQVPFRRVKAVAIGLPLSQQNVVLANLHKYVPVQPFLARQYFIVN